MQIPPLHYTIKPCDPHAHLYSVTLTIMPPSLTGHILSLPSWIPGSYMIRDFAKNIVELQASFQQKPIAAKKIDKQTWQLEPTNGSITIQYLVYAWDLSVRSAHLDQTHAYFNGTSVFLKVSGQEEKPCLVTIENADIPEAKEWKVGTSLPCSGAEQYGFGQYKADNYDDLIDHPVEIANFDRVSFTANGIPHDFILTGLHHADLPRLAKDLTRICEHQINLFGTPAPFQRYVFITWAVGNGYGGLEHRASTSLICNRSDLPNKNEQDIISEGYKTFLGLCSHEYFHSWNVKRIQPDIPYDLSKENHTPLLWAFEGITSYYDDLTLVRTGLITKQEYLELIGKTITRIVRNPGRFKQSAAESSFDTWTKFYKQDENAINAIVSYYSKGAIIALGLDLLLRHLSDGKINLDQVMVLLWQQHGIPQQPVKENTIQDLCKTLLKQLPNTSQDTISQLNLYLENSIYGTTDIDLENLLAPLGVSLNFRESTDINDIGGSEKRPVHNRVDLGITYTTDSKNGVLINRVINGSCSHTAGISAGDQLISLDNIKITSSNLESLLKQYCPGDNVLLHAFRQDVLLQFNIILKAPNTDTAYLSISDENKLTKWLN